MLRIPKMQKKHHFFSFWVSQLSGRGGGGVDLVWTKSQIFPKNRFEGFPYIHITSTLHPHYVHITSTLHPHHIHIPYGQPYRKKTFFLDDFPKKNGCVMCIEGNISQGSQIRLSGDADMVWF